MTTTLKRVNTQNELPDSTRVVIIGGGVVGVSAALTLAERNIPVVLLEKGHIGGEQSSRNLGWIRKTNRHAADVPLALAADKMWAEMPERIGADVGYNQAGIIFLSDKEKELAMYESWLKSVESLELGSKMLSSAEIERLVPGAKRKFSGGVYTPSDGRAEPAIATPAMAEAAVKKGAVMVQDCAVRTLSTSGGKVSGVVTEKGEIRCDQVLLAGGAWSRRFLANHGVSLPTLPLILSVFRTRPINGPTDIAVGGPDFSFRKHPDGGFLCAHRGAIDAPITLDSLFIGHRYMRQLRGSGGVLRVSLGKHFFKDLGLARRWRSDAQSPFEKVRTMNPQCNDAINQDTLANLRQAWPMFEHVEIEEAWAGLMDITPDSNPVIDRIQKIPGLTIATGMSGHGFGTGPAAGALAADLVMETDPIIDPSFYRFDRL